MIIDIIIGAGYGDEGKGSTVNRLASDYREANEDVRGAVVRFNGGAQACHTVYIKDENGEPKHHCFSSFGSGSYQQYDTVIADTALICPISMVEEWDMNPELHLQKVFIDPRAKVVLPFDWMTNMDCEQTKSHGTCGMGIHECMVRSADESLCFTAGMLKLPLEMEKIFHKIIDARNIDISDAPRLFSFLEEFRDAAKIIAERVTFKHCEHAISQYDHVIFEGAQGLFLDEEAEDFPHVTHSHTGMTNVSDILSRLPATTAELNLYYITRAYLTRHGNGPLLKEKDVLHKNLQDIHNQYNPMQGSMRFAPLDFDKMRRHIEKDAKYYPPGLKVHSVITCCDHWNYVKNWYFHIGDIMSTGFIEKVMDTMGATSALLSYDPGFSTEYCTAESVAASNAV